MASPSSARPPAHIRMMGDKITAKDAMRRLGVPLVPGSLGALASVEEARQVAAEIGYPVLIKAAAGGGGRGMKVAQDEGEIEEAWRVARTEAKAAFGNDEVYLEKYLDRPRHIELQVLADTHGNVVHFGERDCSLQRRHQKLVEEAGSPVLNAAERDALGAQVTRALRELGYRNAGTLEFLWQDGVFAFIEMNTRLQVEHPVTEMVCGIDLVKEQLRVAAGEALGYDQSEIRFHGHAIECRITAEDPETFAPSPGKVHTYHAPGGLGVRVDSALYSGYSVPPHYDSLIAKLVVHGATRAEAIARLRRSLAEMVVDGIHTTLPLHRAHRGGPGVPVRRLYDPLAGALRGEAGPGGLRHVQVRRPGLTVRTGDRPPEAFRWRSGHRMAIFRPCRAIASPRPRTGFPNSSTSP